MASTAGAATAEGAPRTAALHDGGATHAAARKARAIIGTPPAVPKGAHPISALRSSTTLQIQVVLTPQDPTALAAYAQEVSTPGSVYYRRFLDPAQFATVFGPSAQSIDTVDASLRAEGLVPGRISADHLSIPVRARAGALARGLSTSFTRYRLKSGRVVFANTKAPQLPAVAARSVQDIVGLDDLVVAQSGAVRVKGSRRATTPAAGAPQVQTGGPQPCASADGGAASGAYTADEVASAYGFSSLYGQGDEGQGQTVAVIEGEPDLASDIAAYQSCYGTDAQVSYVDVDGGPGVSGAGSGEAALDIEQIIGLAPQAHVTVYQSTSSADALYDDYLTAISSDSARVISTSWGICEGLATGTPGLTGESTVLSGLMHAENTLFEEAAAQGQSVVAASGDAGSEGCDPYESAYPGFGSELFVQDPSSQPFVTGVGGTTLPADDAPTSETVWNSYGAGGGGISTLWPMPSYQSGAPAGVGVIDPDSSGAPCLAATGDCRQVPDVSADADPFTGYAVEWNGSWWSFGGTSAAAPLWAAMLALTDASQACGGAPVGFANPKLYAVAADQPGAFNDITTGNNDYTRENGGTYPALPGYDMASGLGAPTANLPPALCSAAGVQFTSASSALFGKGSPASFTVTASGSPSPVLSESGALPSGMHFTAGTGTATLAGTPTGAGSFPIVLRASNGSSTATQAFTVVVGTAPAIVTADAGTLSVGTKSSVRMVGAGSPVPSFTLSAGTLPAGVSLTSTGEITGTPATGTAGTYSVTVQASNGIAPAATQVFTLTVDGQATFASPPAATFVLGTPGSFTVTTRAAPVPALREMGTLPPGMGFTDAGNGTATISGTPTTPGTFALTLAASNSAGTTSQAFTVDVVSSVQAPAITSASSTTMTVMVGGTFQFTATGSPAPTFSIVSGSLPPGPSGDTVTFSSSGLLSGGPYWNTGGVYRLVVEAYNGVGPGAEQTFTLVVQEPVEMDSVTYNGEFTSESPATSAENTADLVLGASGGLTVATQAYPVATMTETGVLPPGTSFVDNGDGTATISGTPTEPGNYVVTVIGTNPAGTYPNVAPDSARTFDLVVARAVAPTFLSAPTVTMATRLAPSVYSCNEFNVVAAGFPAPKVTETGAVPEAIVTVDDGSTIENFNPGSATVTPACGGETGTYSMVFHASNVAGSANQSFTLNLADEKNVQPLFQSAVKATFSSGVYNAFLAFTQPDAYPCIYGTVYHPLPAGVGINVGDGLLSGVLAPGTAGTYATTSYCSWDKSAGGVGTVMQTFTLTVTAPTPPSITSQASTSFALGKQSSVTITAQGSPTPALTETGALPGGVTFADHGNGTATITGVPTTSGSFPLSVSAANSLGAVHQPFDLSVQAAQAPQFVSADSTTFYGTVLGTTTFPGAFQLQASGFPSPTFSLVSGTLPSGLTLSSGGLLSGSAAGGGQYPVVVEASNGVAPTVTQDLDIVVIEAPEFSTPGSLTSTYTGSPLSITVAGTGYPQPTITAYGLPPGMSIVDTPVPGSPVAVTATISGTPHVTTTTQATVRISNSFDSEWEFYTVVIPVIFHVTTTLLPAAVIGKTYSQPLAATGANPPYTWKLERGSKLPRGLHLRSSGLITGRPPKSAAGTYSVTVEVLTKKTHGVQVTATKTLTITVVA